MEPTEGRLALAHSARLPTLGAPGSRQGTGSVSLSPRAVPHSRDCQGRVGAVPPRAHRSLSPPQVSARTFWIRSHSTRTRGRAGGGAVIYGLGDNTRPVISK